MKENQRPKFDEVSATGVPSLFAYMPGPTTSLKSGHAPGRNDDGDGAGIGGGAYDDDECAW